MMMMMVMVVVARLSLWLSRLSRISRSLWLSRLSPSLSGSLGLSVSLSLGLSLSLRLSRSLALSLVCHLFSKFKPIQTNYVYYVHLHENEHKINRP